MHSAVQAPRGWRQQLPFPQWGPQRPYFGPSRGDADDDGDNGGGDDDDGDNDDDGDDDDDHDDDDGDDDDGDGDDDDYDDDADYDDAFILFCVVFVFDVLTVETYDKKLHLSAPESGICLCLVQN